MVAYSFNKRFVDPIVSGTKTQTIRGNGKRRHARVGEALQLYFGMRTKQCMKIIADPICELSVPITISVRPKGIKAIWAGGEPVADLETFARSDGFTDLADMFAYWLDNFGAGDFQGTLIGWSHRS